MNTLQQIQQYAGALQRDFIPIEMIELADMYLVVRTNLNELYNYLPDPEKKKYYGFFTAVTEYEKKIADGTYNPDIDGILNFDWLKNWKDTIKLINKWIRTQSLYFNYYRYIIPADLYPKMVYCCRHSYCNNNSTGTSV